jgi:CRISPR-associated protein Csm5
MSEPTFQQKRDALGTRYQLRVRTLSPVHVGSGESDLRRNLDFVSREGRLFVLDPDKLARQLDATQLDRFLSGQDLNQIVPSDKLADIAAYTLPAPSGQANRIRPHVKIPGSPPRPYLPGSSIKGALRTALAWAMLQDGAVTIANRDLGRNRYFADSAVERRLFGSDPNHDLLRALHVGDTDGLPPDTLLTLTQVSVYSIRQGGLQTKGNRFQFHLEAIGPDVEIVAATRRDNYLLEPAQIAKLRWDKNRSYLVNVVRHVNDFAAGLIEQELVFYRRQGPASLVSFYEQLEQTLSQIKTTGSTCLCQIAWGTGWTAKTAGTALDEAILARVRRNYRLGRANSPFPKTRRLVEVDGQPVAALGWLTLTFQPEGEEIALPDLPAIRQKPATRPADRPAGRRLADLRVGETLQGRVTNTREYGAFVDIGVGRDGLIHISNLAEGFVNRVEDVVQPGDTVTVEIVDLDLKRRRIGLRLVE